MRKPVCAVVVCLAFCVYADEPPDDAGLGVAINSDGGVYVGGNSRLAEETDVFQVLKYGDDGQCLWSYRYATEWRAWDSGFVGVEFDEEGDLVVANWSDSVVSKLAPTGEVLWKRGYIIGDVRVFSRGMALAPDGSIFLSDCRFEGDYYYGVCRAYILRLNPDGESEWTYELSSGVPEQADDFNDIAADSRGGVYVSGSVGYLESGESYPWEVIRIDEAGVETWSRSPGDGSASDIAVDAEDNVVCTGHLAYEQTDASVWEFATVKYDPDGNLLWLQQHADSGIDPEDGASNELAVGPDGSITMTGAVYQERYDSDVLTIRYDPDGEILWIATYDGPADNDKGSWDEGDQVAVDETGNVYVLADLTVDYETDDVDIAVIKYDPEGNREWVFVYDGPGHGTDIGYAVAVDDAGRSAVTGAAVVSSGNADWVTIRLDEDGELIWSDFFEDGDSCDGSADDDDDNEGCGCG